MKVLIVDADRVQWLADEVRKTTREIAAREREAIHRLSRASAYRDPETGAHLVRMAQYARLLGAAERHAPAAATWRRAGSLS